MLCDKAAANRHDLDLPECVEGVELEVLEPSAKVIAACRRATEREPAPRRFMFELGRVELRAGKSKDAAKAFAKASKEGSAAGTHALGYLYSHGCGVPKDEKRMRELYEEAIAQGQTMSMMNLGNMLLNGFGKAIPADPVRGRQLILKAAALGNGDAMSELADWIFFAEQDQGKDVPHALQLYETARQARSRRPYWVLFNLYTHGDFFGLKSDPERGSEILEEGVRRRIPMMLNFAAEQSATLSAQQTSAVQKALIDLNLLHGKADGTFKKGELQSLRKLSESAKYFSLECE
jgi:TPR repeat protein